MGARVQLISALAGEMALVPLTLLPIINPLSIASIFVSLVGARHTLARTLARQIAVNSFSVIVAAMLVGTYVLSLFGISLSVVRLGGGLLVAATAWQMLSARDNDTGVAQAAGAAVVDDGQLQQKAFYPLSFPLTTGPGTLAACIALGAHGESITPLNILSGVIVAIGGAAMVAVVIYLVLRNSIRVMTRLGAAGTRVLQQLVAFVLLCVGIQLMWSGWQELNSAKPVEQAVAVVRAR